MSTDLDLRGPLPTGRLVVEASAGTGKTYSLSALVVRHVAERDVPMSALLVVTFTRAAAAELRDRTRRSLVAASTALATGDIPSDAPWMAVLRDDGDPEETERRRQRLDAAVATFDDATITTIHGFCQQALRQLGLRSGTRIDSELGDSTAAIVDEVCRDLVVAALVDDPHALDWPKDGLSPGSVLSNVIDAVRTVLGNPGATVVPDVATAQPATNDTAERLAAWVALVDTAVAEVGRRRRARRELGYDDLVTSLRDAVCHPVTGPVVAASLRSKYTLVLVDEFQDTDPVQWQIFDTAFADGDLVTVGDPKQAIYRFRGADVHAYLNATEGVAPVRLATNYRSDADLVRATNLLLDGMELGDPRIVAGTVEAARTDPPSALQPGAPLVIRQLPRHDKLLTATGRVSAPLSRRAIVADVVATTLDLLTTHTITGQRGEERVGPGDIAVLVPSHAAADEITRALARAGIPAVRTRTGSVFEAPAGRDWAALLAALERPSHAPSARAAGLGVFLHLAPADLDPQSPDAATRLAVLQQRLARWADQLASRPFLGWYSDVRADSALVTALLGSPDGERQLTDIDHIAELLAVELGPTGTTAASARRTLDRLTRDATDLADPGPQMRRIDSDAQAVQVTTVHGSKGLEYPVVLLPMTWHTNSSRGTLVYNDDSGTRLIDIATGQGWSGPDIESSDKGRKHLADVAQSGDALRLLYVAMTRGVHRTVMWWAPTPGSDKSAANVLFFDRDDEGRPLRTQPTLDRGPKGAVRATAVSIRPPADDVARERFEALAARSNGTITVEDCPLDQPRRVWIPDAPDVAAPALGVADAGGRTLADPAWRRWSFTSLTNTRDHEWTPHPTPVVGGADEPTPDDADTRGDDTGLAPAAPAIVPTGPPMPWSEVPGGTDFGTLVHTVLEHVDPASPDLDTDLRSAVSSQLRRDRLDVAPGVLVDGLSAAIATSLGPIADGRRLADVAARDRLAELDFDMPLSSAAQRITAAQIGQVLLDTLPADDPQRPYAASLADARFDVDLAGYLQGSIDAVLRVPDGDDARYLVVDYKTNRLHDRGALQPLDAYHPDLLPAAMAHSDYPLQSILYSVALHRYLRWRIGDRYRPDRHLGGIAYLFLRGMVGAGTPVVGGQPYSVFAWRPPARTVLALDALLATGVAT